MITSRGRREKQRTKKVPKEPVQESSKAPAGPRLVLKESDAADWQDVRLAARQAGWLARLASWQADRLAG